MKAIDSRDSRDSHSIYYIFSYWIFAWYILYICNIVEHGSPKLALMVGLYYNSFMLILMICMNVNARQIFYFFIMMVLLKIIPLLTLWNVPVDYWNDGFQTGILFVIFIAWSISTHHTQTLHQAIESQTRFLKNSDKMPGPGMQWLKQHL